MLVKSDLFRADYASHPLISRAEAFLLTRDSQSSFEIEKEKFDNRAVHWMKTVRAFMDSKLDAGKLFEMQKQLVSNPDHGWRTDFGWIGDRLPDATPLPEHISAHPDSLNDLMGAWLRLMAACLTVIPLPRLRRWHTALSPSIHSWTGMGVFTDSYCTNWTRFLFHPNCLIR